MSNKNNKLLTLKQLLYIIAGGILLTSWFSLTPSSYFFVAIPVGIFCLFLIIYEDEKEKEKSWAVFLLKNQIVLIVIILIIIGVSIIISLTSDDEYKTITFEVENNSERIEEEIGDAKEISNFIIEPISVPILDDAINQLEPVSEPEPESETKPEVQPENQIAVITKIIDGNTVVIESGDHVRLLGIDADESGYPCYYEAKNRLKN